MCGIVSVIGKHRYGFHKAQLDVFDTLLSIDALRGEDSTGVFLVNNQNEMELIKEASHAGVFRRNAEYRSLMTTALKNGAVLVGHNRAATKGNVTDENAHPFVVDDKITLVHNGTLYNHKALADTEVDSHAIAHTIHKYGDNVEAAIQELNGAFALVWHDYERETINFLRNTQRPLYWVETKDAWYWSSESIMLQFALARCGEKPLAPPSLLKEGTLCSYKWEGKDWDVTNTEIKMTKPVQSAAYFPTQSRYGDWYGDEDDYNLCQYGTRTPPAATETPSKEVTQAPVVAPVLAPPKPVAGVITQKEYLSQAARAKEDNELQDIAHANKVNISCTAAGIEWAKYKEKDYWAIKFVDYKAVKENKPEMGWFAYGLLEDNNNLLVRVHVNPAYPEMDLLDHCLNNHRALVCLRNHRTWTAYREAAHGHGFAILQAASFRLITQEEEANAV
jgi:hypothetical protein